MKNHFLLECLCCNSKDLNLTLDLGMQQLANSYRKHNDEVLPSYPLALNTCRSCYHSQLSYVVDRKIIFDDYSYVSGTSQTLLSYFDWFANALVKSNLVGNTLEIACNDGSLLNYLFKYGIPSTGIDPAENIVKRINNPNLNIIQGYFPRDFKSKHLFDCIIAMNVLAHVDNPLEFFKGIKKSLAKDGVVIIQPSQVRMFEFNQFDTIYHEHISFFNSRSISSLAKRAGLKLVDATIAKIHGDSPIYFLKHIDDDLEINTAPFKCGTYGINENLFHYENKINLFKPGCYIDFSANSKKIINDLTNFIKIYKDQNYSIFAVGAAAKAMTVFNAANIDIQFLDEAPLKISKFPPGSSFRVENFDYCKDKGKCIFIISAWNFSEEIRKKLSHFNSNNDNLFITYFPTLQIFK